MSCDQVAVLGAAFDPPHRGHIDVVAQALLHFDRVLLVPSAAHAFAKQMSPFASRFEMTAMTLTALCPEVADRTEVSAIEKELVSTKPGPVYTYDLLRYLAAQQVETQYRFVVGPDNAAPAQWARFYHAKQIKAEFGLFIAKERLAIRSSDCRQQIMACYQQGHSLNTLRSCLASSVCHYIAKHRLYDRKQEVR